jgi:hypothetical protein
MIIYTYTAPKFSLYLQIEETTGRLVVCFSGKGRLVKTASNRNSPKLN